MSKLKVTPEYLEKLAAKQAEAAAADLEAAKPPAETQKWIWVTHGVMSGFSNVAGSAAESSRRAAAEALQQVSLDLAAKLRTGKQVYTAVDEETGQNLDKQMSDK